MIAAVTGGTGFIGAALVSRLQASRRFSEVRVLSRRGGEIPGAHVVPADLLDGPLEAFVQGADLLFHCAGEVRREEAMRAVHVEGTRRLLDAARGRVGRWVQLSSVGAYGGAVREGVIEEGSPLFPQGEYEVTKTQADELVTGAGIPSVILRPSIVFGPGMRNRSVYQLAAAVDRGLFFFIGRGAVANYVYVDDVADALIACGCLPGASGVYLLSDDRPMEAFVGALAAALGKVAPRWRAPESVARLAARVMAPLPGFPLSASRVEALTRKVHYSSRRIQRELGYSFGVSIEEGLRRLVADWRRAA